MTANPDAELIRTLGARVVEVLRREAGEARLCALIDFPNHNNVGDSAIWAGERIALRQAGWTTQYVADLASFRAAILRRRLQPGGTVFLHGGGNLGSTWPHHHRFRLAVLRELTDYRVVQLPQSAHFDDDRDRDEFIETVASHPSAHLYLRDRASLDALSRLGARASLLPDSAFVIGPVERPRAAVRDVIVLARTDHESAVKIPGSSGVERVDWLVGEPGRSWMAALHRVTVRTRTASNKLLARHDALASRTEPLRAPLFDALAGLRVARGYRTLSRGRVVVTDRLHGHILSMLLGLPHVLLDNSYSKIARFRGTFTSTSALAHTASSGAEAVALAREMATRT